MPRRIFTVQDLVNSVRDLIDEANADSITDANILSSLNRGLDHAANTLSGQYPDPFIRYSTVSVSSAKEVDIPEDCLEDRVLRVEVEYGGVFTPVTRMSAYDMGPTESDSQSMIPEYYAIAERKIRFNRPASGTADIRICYMRQPEQLVLPLGRITQINSGNNYVLVDEVGDDLTTETDQLESYVNIVDTQTGLIKGSLQVQLIEDNKLTFRSSPTRSVVLNRDVSSSIATTVEIDDVIANIRGTAVPEFGQPLTNYLLQYAVADLNVAKFGADPQAEEMRLSKFEKPLKTAWSGRETQKRIQPRSPYLGRLPRRYIITSK